MLVSAPDAAGTESAAPPPGRIARFLRTRTALIIAIVLTLALVAVAAVTAVRFFAPPAPAVALGEPMPSAFVLEVQIGGSPAITRGETATILVSGRSDRTIDSLELWADDHPYIVIDGDDMPEADQFGTIRLSLDYVPVGAGSHLVYARATDDQGGVAQSSPAGLSVLDLPEELGLGAAVPSTLQPSDMSIESVPGDTVEKVAARLMVTVPELTFWSPIDPAAVMPPGTHITAPVHLLPPDETLAVYPEITWKPGLSISVDACTLQVTSTIKTTVRLYGGPGNVYIGDVLGNGKTLVGNLPLGKLVITGLPVGASKPLMPMSVIVPDECARDGWTGDAVVSGGVLITEDPVEKPYVFIAVDKRQWLRVPGKEGSTLASGRINDLRSFIDLKKYDQLDVQVWTGDGFTAQMVAEGHYCRKNATSALAGSSQSGGECDPPGAPPAPTGLASSVAAGFALTIEPAAGSTAIVNLFDQVGYDQVVMGTGPITLTTNAHGLGYQHVRFQFSFLPISQLSPNLTAPGVFHHIDAYTAYGESTVTFDPTAWQHVSLEQALEGEELALQDQMAFDIAQANAIDGFGVVGNQIYVRAVALTGTGPDGTPPLSMGIATENALLFMQDSIGQSLTYPSIVDPKITLIPGLDENASWTAANDPTSNWDQSIQTYGSQSVAGTCVEVISYPTPGVYTVNTGAAGKTIPADKDAFADNYSGGMGIGYGAPADQDVVIPPDPTKDDYHYALARFPDKDAVYCIDEAAGNKRYTAAYEAAKENAKCTLGCVLTLIVYGAAQGFLLGGPIGAVIGAIAGLYLGVLSYASPAFYKDLKKLWDQIAAIYNVAFDRIAAVLDKIDPICRGIGSLGEDAGEFCTSTVHVAAQAVISYYTKLPPRLNTTDELDAVADGQLEAAFELLLDAALKKLGLSCDTFTLESSEASDLFRKAGRWDKAFGEKGTNLSGCKVLATIVVGEVRKALDKRQVEFMADIIGMPPIQGLVIAPIADRSPSVLIEAPESSYTKWGSGCPVVVNTTITENGRSYKFRPETSTIQLHRGIPTAAGVGAQDPFWYAQVPVGVPPQTYWHARPTGTGPIPPSDYWMDRKHSYVDQASILSSKTAEHGTPYLHVVIDSPCFDKTYVFDAPKYAGTFAQLAGVVPAFELDQRKAVGFW